MISPGTKVYPVYTDRTGHRHPTSKFHWYTPEGGDQRLVSCPVCGCGPCDPSCIEQAVTR